MRSADCVARTVAVVVVVLALGAARRSEPLFIRASQLGDLPADPKIAVLFAREGVLPAAFEVVDGSGAVAAAAVYHDDWQDYSSNEPTMDGTASAVLLMALQRGAAATSPAASRPSR